MIDKRKTASEYDWGLIGIYILLLAFGLFNLLSATGGGEGFLYVISNPSKSFTQQFWFVLGGFVLMLLFSRIDYRYFERMAYFIFILCILSLILVLIMGPKISGSTRWIPIGGFRLQPSEPGKLAMIIILAKYFQKNIRGQHFGLTDLFLPIVFVAIPLVLLCLEPDLGTGLFYTMVASSMILFAGVRPKPLIFLTILAIAGGFFAYHFLLHDYQQGRILTFFNPQRDPLGKGYHVIQSLIAVGSGRFWGKGFLAGSQSQLKFIPEQHTDFIFSVLAEEWGFVGCFFLLLLYFVLLIKCLDIAAKARDRFGAFMAVGIAAMFFWQIVVNLGGVLGLLPITGITLPFLSYGGSSIITLSIAVGILQNISMRRFIF